MSNIPEVVVIDHEGDTVIVDTNQPVDVIHVAPIAVQGPQGPPGAMSDADIADLIENPSTDTSTTLNALYVSETELDPKAATLIENPNSATSAAIEKRYEPATVVALGADAAANSTNLQAAITSNQGTHQMVYLPAGDWTFATSVTITNRVRIHGAGRRLTILRPAPTLADPLIIINDCWRVSGNENESAAGSHPDADGNKAGVSLTDLSIIGDRANPCAGIRCTGRNDNVSIERVFFGYLKGTALHLGHGNLGLVRESVFRDLTFRNCGDGATNHGVIITTGSGAGDGTNQLHFEQIEMVYPYGIGIQLTSEHTTATRRIDFGSLMLHGGVNTTDTMAIEGNVDSVSIRGARMNGAEAGFAVIAVRTRLGRAPSTIHIDGDIRQTTTGIKVSNVNAISINVTAQAASISDKPVEFTASSVGEPSHLVLLGALPTIDASIAGRVTGTWGGVVHGAGGTSYVREVPPVGATIGALWIVPSLNHQAWWDGAAWKPISPPTAAANICCVLAKFAVLYDAPNGGGAAVWTNSGSLAPTSGFDLAVTGATRTAKGYVFDGVNDDASSINTIDLNFGPTESFTMIAVIKAGATFVNNAPILTKRASMTGVGAGWLLGSSATASTDSKTQFVISDGAVKSTALSPAMTPSARAVLVGVRDVPADNITCYLNGVAGTPVTDVTTVTPSIPTQPLRVGRISGVYGAIPEGFLFGVARSALTVADITLLQTWDTARAALP
jgi:Pectate lyase superfamily protein